MCTEYVYCFIFQEHCLRVMGGLTVFSFEFILIYACMSVSLRIDAVCIIAIYSRKLLNVRTACFSVYCSVYCLEEGFSLFEVPTLLCRF
jgi:hypothetical protein